MRTARLFPLLLLVAVLMAPEGLSAGETPRFRLTVGMAFPAGSSSTSLTREGTFRFPQEALPEAGPYPYTLRQGSDRPGGGELEGHVRFGPVGLAYAWTEKWLLEFELFVRPPSRGYAYGDLRFTSAADGLDYEGLYQRTFGVRFTDVLFGVAFRPVVPEALQRHGFEIGMAAGPSFVSARRLPYSGDPPPVRGVAFGARIRAAYDFYFLPALSLGAFAEFRYARARASAVLATETLTYSAGPVAEFEPLVRPTELGLLSFPIEGSGLYLGIRFGFRI